MEVTDKFIIGIKIWLILLLGILIMLPVTIIKEMSVSISDLLYYTILILSLLITFFVYGWLFIKFKNWLYKWIN